MAPAIGTKNSTTKPNLAPEILATIKSRLSLQAVLHRETYELAGQDEAIAPYNEVMEALYHKIRFRSLSISTCKIALPTLNSQLNGTLNLSVAQVKTIANSWFYACISQFFQCH